MAKLLQSLIPILFLLATTARSQTTSFTYDFLVDRPNDLILQGTAHYPSATSPLRLTEATFYQVGRALHSGPIQFWNGNSQVDFETTISFIITPSPASGFTPAEGLAFFIAPVGSTIPPASSENLGIFDNNGNGPSVFAIVYDPVTATWQGRVPHVGINLGKRSPANATLIGDTIFVQQQVTAKINYVAATKRISAVVTVNGQTFEVNYEYDLRKLLNQQVQVGLSASTGLVFAAHDVVSWDFTATMVNDDAGATKSKTHLSNVIQQFV